MKAKSVFITIVLTGLLISCGQSAEHDYQGYVEGENIYLASPNSGLLTQLAVERGQVVHKGQLLFKLDAYPQQDLITQYEQDLQQAKNLLQDLKNPRRTPEVDAIKAQIAQTDAQLRLAQIRVDRNQKLYSKQATDKDHLDEAMAIYEQQLKLKEQYQANLTLAQLGSREEQINAQQAQIQSLQARLHTAKWELAQKTLYAPAQGLIFDTFFRENEFVGAQQPVLALLTPANVHIEFFVPVEELASLSLGKPIRFTCSGCEHEGKAWINYISPEAEYLPPLVYSRENNSKLVFRIQARINDFNRFKPGQPVVVRLQ